MRIGHDTRTKQCKVVLVIKKAAFSSFFPNPPCNILSLVNNDDLFPLPGAPFIALLIVIFMEKREPVRKKKQDITDLSLK